MGERLRKEKKTRREEEEARAKRRPKSEVAAEAERRLPETRPEGKPLARGAGDRVRTGDVQLGRLTLYQLSYSREIVVLFGPVEGVGFEPTKAMPADLQSAPFGHSGNPPGFQEKVFQKNKFSADQKEREAETETSVSS